MGHLDKLVDVIELDAYVVKRVGGLFPVGCQFGHGLSGQGEGTLYTGEPRDGSGELVLNALFLVAQGSKFGCGRVE